MGDHVGLRAVRFGAPIRWPELGPDAADDPEALEPCYREVETRMQATLTDLGEGRRFLLGEPS